MSAAELFSSPIAFHRCLVGPAGSINAALMLSQACYWTPRCSMPGGWFWKVQSDWEEETGLTRHEQDGARKMLVERGLLRVEKRGVPPRLHFQVQDAALRLIARGLIGENDAPNRQIESRISANQNAANRQINTETTAETTANNSSLALRGGERLAEELVELVYAAYPRKVGRTAALKAIRGAVARLVKGEGMPPMAHGDALSFLRDRAEAFARSEAGRAGSFTPHPASWFNGGRYHDDDQAWRRSDGKRSNGASRTGSNLDAFAEAFGGVGAGFDGDGGGEAGGGDAGDAAFVRDPPLVFPAGRCVEGYVHAQ